MSARMSSSLVLVGGVLVVLAMWYLSYLTVRWDTQRRGLRPIVRKAWIAASIALPLLGFATYLFVQVLQRYLTPSAGEPNGRTAASGGRRPGYAAGSPGSRSTWHDDAGTTDVYARAAKAPSGASLPVSGRTKDPGEAGRDALRQEPLSGPAWGDTYPAHSNGKTHDFKAPETVRAAAQPMQARYLLIVVEGPMVGQQFILDSLPARIGRGPEVGVALDADLNISRKHAEIYEWNGMLRIRDLGSLHGVQVNGIPANDQVLSPGDRISLGGTVFILRELT